MKKLLMTTSAIALSTGMAFAASTSNSNEEVRVFNPDDEVLLDAEATGAISQNAEGIFQRTYYDGGYTVTETFTLDADGNRMIISTQRDVSD